MNPDQKPQQPNENPNPQPVQVVSPTNNTINQVTPESEIKPVISKPITQPVVAQPVVTEQAVSPEPVLQPVTSQVLQQANEQAQPAINPIISQNNPGKSLAIVSLVLAFIFMNFIGLILAIIAKVKSKKAGQKNTLATVSIVLNSILLVFSAIFVTLFLLLFIPAFQARSLTASFVSDVVSQDYESAVALTVSPTEKTQLSSEYIKYINSQIGTEQKEIAAASEKSTYGFVYETNGESKYLRVIVKDGIVYDASVDTMKLEPLSDTLQITE